MSFLESKPYRVLEVCTNFILLSFLWVLACLPVITIFPATAAMFGVVREWVKGREPGILGAFWACLLEHLKQSLLASVVWVLAGAVLATNVFFIFQGGSTAVGVALSMLTIVPGLAYLGASVYLFPVMVSYEDDLSTVLKNSLLFALGHLGTTLAGLALIGAAILVSVILPITLLAAGSVTAYLIYRLCDRTFQKVTATKAS